MKGRGSGAGQSEVTCDTGLRTSDSPGGVVSVQPKMPSMVSLQKSWLLCPPCPATDAGRPRKGVTQSGRLWTKTQKLEPGGSYFLIVLPEAGQGAPLERGAGGASEACHKLSKISKETQPHPNP